MLDETNDSEAAQELRLLQDSARTLLERVGGVARARALRGNTDGWDSTVMGEIAEAGMLGIMAPETAGGLGMGLEAAGVIATEIGRALAPEPVVPVVGLVVGMLHRICPDDAGLAEAIAGESVAALAWQERDPQGRLADTMACRYEGNTLSGSKAWVAGAMGADHFLVVAESQNGPALVRVTQDAKGFSKTPMRQSDGSHLLELLFDSTPGELLAEGPQVAEALAAAIADTTALAAAELVGVTEKALEITLEFLKTREQFGKAIGSFQAIQHRAVDMHLNIEIARASITETLPLIDAATDAATRTRQSSRAKARACTAALKITREAVQMHGAVGYTDELDVGLYLNRAIMLSAWLGDAATHRRRWLEIRETGGDTK